MTTFFLLANAAASLVVAIAAAYFFLAAGLGVRRLRRSGVGLGSGAKLEYGLPFTALPDVSSGSQREWHLYFLVPCLNEAAVIARTVRGLLDPSGRARTIVVDDGSDDDTAEIAERAGLGQVVVVRRELPQARQGKGAALNAGFGHLLADVAARRLDPARVIVCVMDADGRLSNGAIDAVLPLFDDPAVGGAQLAVRIRNRRRNFWLRFQDHQFWNLSALTQYGRVGTGTVSLGGNGQFTRLTALGELGTAPWSNALTEDLDLAISLGVRGWQLVSTPRAAVDQQGVERLRLLVRQRVRWYQGHMMTARRLPEVLRSTRMSNAASIEMALYLLVPWLLDLPWSVLYHVILVEIGLRIAHGGTFQAVSGSWWATAAFWYLLGFWPALVTAYLAKRRDPVLRWQRAVVLGHAFVLTNYLSYLCVWTALMRILTGRNSWAKTARVAEGRTFDRPATTSDPNDLPDTPPNTTRPSPAPAAGGRNPYISTVSGSSESMGEIGPNEVFEEQIAV